MQVNTDLVAPGDRVAYWQDAVCRHYLPVECAAVERAPVWGRFAHNQAGPLRLSLFESSAQRYATIPSRRHDVIMFDVVLSGTLGIEQSNERSRITRDGIGVSDLRRPLVQTFALAEQRCRSLVVEAEVARLGRSVQRGPAAVALPAREGLRRLIRQQARALYAECAALSPAARSAAGHGLLGLLLLALNEDGGGRGKSNDVVHRAEGILQALPVDTPLDVEALARALRVSRRTLFRQFAAAGSTPSAAFLMIRLDKAHAAITRADGRSSLTQVALDHGFADHAHFSRAFKARYGVTPSVHRANHIRTS